MNGVKGKCFVIMPFKSDAIYFYLYLKQQIEVRHGLQCERADEQVQTIPLIEKIRVAIADADVIIADCTGQNPNVFYELGIADTLNKLVILITRDDPKTHPLPLDVRQREFIIDDRGDYRIFLPLLDSALNYVLYGQYEPYYDKARES